MQRQPSLGASHVQSVTARLPDRHRIRRARERRQRAAFAQGAMAPGDKFDLVIKGGDVLDPSQSLRGTRDIGIRSPR
jgi:hypothetical protein